MPPIVASLVLTAAVFVGAPVGFLFLYFLIESYRNNDFKSLLWATAIAAPVYILVWVLIWREHVRWNSSRTLQTIVAAGASALAGLGAFGALVAVRQNRYFDSEFALVLADMVFAVVWIFASTAAWRETEYERTTRLGRRGASDLPCPKCGYNMTGLQEARCPECGTSYTLDELVAGMVEQRTPLSMP